ncbi:MAG: 4Fe-4S binding protein [Gemmatimonadetes bacterium]|nr:4Fe-4S binding protein [Gemmatimonadota bacterium]
MELQPLPFPDLLLRMRREVETNGSIFDLPARKWHVPDGKLDYSALHFARRASTPVGPAAGPHTQLAQNIVLSWLAGSRIIEIKTVQVNDRLEIPRPCIHVPNIGYNVEWSQELRVGESLMEYAKAAYLIEILKETRGFGVFPSDSGFDTVFDISVGYDLEGIRTEKVTGFIRALKEPREAFDELRGQLTGDLSPYADLDLPEPISDTVTLSTFHGCPADQIEGICRYLLEQVGVHTIIKLNPTLLGFERVRKILIDRLGYEQARLRPDAFEVDLQYDEGLEILRRLRSVAEDVGSIVGAKFTNTLVVENDLEIFPTQTDPYMYLSGPPLHVIAMNLMQRFREDLGFEFPVSFSAGIDVKNFPAAVACGMVPVTTCTDLLRQGGFGRLPGYLRALAREMEKSGVTTREAYVLAACGHGIEAVGETLGSFPGGSALLPAGARLKEIAAKAPDDLPAALRGEAAGGGLDGDALVLHATRVAGRLNGRDIVPPLVGDLRYHAASNSKSPRGIDSVLGLYDCINCDLCIWACPNDAIFAYEVEPVEAATETLRITEEGGPEGSAEFERSAGRGFVVAESHQLAVFEGACNDCSNCEVYCPESGAPFKVKELLFRELDGFQASDVDGFCRTGDTLHARLAGREYVLLIDAGSDRAAVSWDGCTLDLAWDSLEVLGGRSKPRDQEPATAAGDHNGTRRGIDTAELWRMKTVWDSIFHSPTPNPIRLWP